MAMIIISTQRAQRLAKLQMEFVTGISHELRTPLAVICSAGDNLADGIVLNSEKQVKQYGELIRTEGRRLSHMVEQILQFSQLQAGRKHYNLREVGVEKAIEAALMEAGPMIDSAGFTIEKSIAPNLPSIKVDKAALSQCLQNLISNAIKYGGESRWMRVLAEMKSVSNDQQEVLITVEDRGIGIETSDLPHIFDPFYRGNTVTSAQIHGSGLGLSLTQDMIASLGGRITVRSSPGRGSAFTIHLPAHLPETENHSNKLS
jgi:signal transduction histidine kinase